MSDATHEALPSGLTADSLPLHLAIIMDGNGRWAEAQGLPRSEGHRAGTEAVNRVVRWCRSWGLRHLTLYAFSEQNWGRPEEEVGALMSLLLQYVREQREEIIERRIRLRVIGDEARLPSFVRGPLKALIQESAQHEGMTLTLALSYGGREELLRATKRIAAQVQQGTLSLDALSEEHISGALDAPDLPDPDLIFRTSGERRLSNFLLWQCAYSELYFLERPWPEVRAQDLIEAFEHFAQRQRRFGLTSAQVSS